MKFFWEELVSGTADWSDTTNTLNNTVKHVHWCVTVKINKQESSRNEITFEPHFITKNRGLYFNTPYKFAHELMHKQKSYLEKMGGSF